jgi:hypothetical protein
MKRTKQTDYPSQEQRNEALPQREFPEKAPREMTVSQRAGQVDEAEKEENLWKKVEEGLLCWQHPPNAGPLLSPTLSICSDLSQRQGCILGWAPSDTHTTPTPTHPQTHTQHATYYKHKR